MDETREYIISDMSVRARQIPSDFTHRWNLRKKTNDPRGKKERGKPRNKLLTIENKLMVTRGEVGLRRALVMSTG